MSRLWRDVPRHLYAYWLIWRDPVRFARWRGVTVGTDCRLIDLRPQSFGSEPYLIELGDHVTVTSGVLFLTHDGGVWVFRGQHPDVEVFGRINVGCNVFIGVNAIIMPGVTIGEDSIVAAGAVITSDVPPRSVVAGVPGRVVKSVDEYWETVSKKAVFSRSLPPEEKRRFLLHRFGADGARGPE